jgi:three-Cys-motif partner protein
LVDLEKPVRFVFVENRQDRLDHLRGLVATRFPSIPSHISVEFVNDACEVVWEGALTASNAWDQPIFANLDPFGPGVPHALVDRLGSNPGSEVLVTFMSDWLRRFAALEDIDDGDRQFGSTRWRDVGNLSSPEEKELFLVRIYRETLDRAGLSLTAPFKLSDEGGHAFYLIYGTGHPLGLDRMKAAMWKIDPVTGIQFRDPRDPNQGVLDFGQSEPDLSSLARRLEERVSSVAPNGLTLDELRDFALFETAFRKPHATTAVRKLLAEQRLRRNPEAGQLSGRIRLSLPRR